MRTKLGLTQAEMAFLLGFSFVSVNRWECEITHPNRRASAVIKIAERAVKRAGTQAVLKVMQPRCTMDDLIIALVHLGDE